MDLLTLGFLLFCIVLVIIYYLVPKAMQWWVLLAASLYFYAMSGIKNMIYVLITALSTYAATRMIQSLTDRQKEWIKANKKTTSKEERAAYKAHIQAKRRAILVAALLLNFGILCTFKYLHFLIAQVNTVISSFGASPINDTLKLIIPLGISFYTFQAVSYLIDVYWDDCAASHNFINFASYISLFPQLIAGPIVRYKDVNEQLVSRKETPTMFNSGVRLFVVGMAKKVLLANQFGMLWDAMSADPVAAGALGAWAGACAYTLQIYFDFAGYSDMARGLGRMLGFEFCINFNYPYISKSVTEFWRRWHISLSTWFRDYVYIPLGGNRRGKVRQCVNILIVWALTGFWHGAGWNFLFWGFYYGVLLLLEKLLLGKYIRRLPSFFQHLYAMVIVIIGWVFFASPDLSTALHYIGVMFSFSPGTMGGLSLVMPWVGMAVIGVVASTPLAKNLWEKARDKKAMPLVEGLLCLAALLLCTASLVSDSYNPFLYFRF